MDLGGTAANRTLQASLPDLVDPRQRIDEKSIRLLPYVSAERFAAALATVEWTDPPVDEAALRGLKFSAALPRGLAMHTVGARLGDVQSAMDVVNGPRMIVR